MLNELILYNHGVFYTTLFNLKLINRFGVYLYSLNSKKNVTLTILNFRIFYANYRRIKRTS